MSNGLLPIDLREIGAIARRVCLPYGGTGKEWDDFIAMLRERGIRVPCDDPFAPDPDRDRAEDLLRELERAGFELRRSR